MAENPGNRNPFSEALSHGILSGEMLLASQELFITDVQQITGHSP